MKPDTLNRVLDALGPFLMALGITLPVGAFLAGLLLAVSAALAVRAFMPEKDRRELFWTIVVAILAAICAAWVAHMWQPDIVVQLKMMAAGAASRFAVALFVRIGMTAEARGAQFAGRVIDRVLPDDKKDGEK